MNIGLIPAWTALAVVAHLLSIQTPVGVLRIELAFLLAYRCALMPSRTWLPVLTFAVPALLFDVLDNTNAGLLSHLAVFLIVRRLKTFTDFTRFPACLIFALILAVIDRALYGLWMGYRIGVGTSMMGSAILDPAYLLTALLLPFGLFRLRTHEQP